LRAVEKIGKLYADTKVLPHIMKLKKRDCPLSFKLIPRGGGWTHVYMNVGEERIFFIITNVMGQQFNDLVRALYFFTPGQRDSDRADDIVDCKVGVVYNDTNKVVEVRDDLKGLPMGSVFREIAYRAEFSWDEEGSSSKWVLEREPTEDTEFVVKLHIEIHRNETKVYDYEFRYADLCYAVAKACTATLKKYGFLGYHYSTYHENFNITQLLYLKAIALRCLEVRELQDDGTKYGGVSNLQKEIELLLFDM
jgi:hypothetical protein